MFVNEDDPSNFPCFLGNVPARIFIGRCSLLADEYLIHVVNKTSKLHFVSMLAGITGVNEPRKPFFSEPRETRDASAEHSSFLPASCLAFRAHFWGFARLTKNGSLGPITTVIQATLKNALLR